MALARVGRTLALGQFADALGCVALNRCALVLLVPDSLDFVVAQLVDVAAIGRQDVLEWLPGRRMADPLDEVPGAAADEFVIKDGVDEPTAVAVAVQERGWWWLDAATEGVGVREFERGHVENRMSADVWW